MKKMFICHVVDKVSESIISTFTAPTLKYFDRQMEKFFEDCQKKSIPVTDFIGFIVASVDVCESYDEAMSRIDEAYSYDAELYLDKEDECEVSSDVQ